MFCREASRSKNTPSYPLARTFTRGKRRLSSRSPAPPWPTSWNCHAPRMNTHRRGWESMCLACVCPSGFWQPGLSPREFQLTSFNFPLMRWPPDPTRAACLWNQSCVCVLSGQVILLHTKKEILFGFTKSVCPLSFILKVGEGKENVFMP